MRKHTRTELIQMQSIPLSIKVRMTENRIQEWVDSFGLDGVYVSFSGGKDSTVLLDIARSLYPDILAVFVDTGLEYPEVRKFVDTYERVVTIKPKKNFRQVIEEYGYPMISKEVADKIQGARQYVQAVKDAQNLKSEVIPKENARYRQVMGTYLNKDGKPSIYNLKKYNFLLYAPFEISAKCCDVMKKSPVHEFSRKTGRKPMTAQMASESFLREQQWLKNGCNGFQMASPISNPMAFWTEQDVLMYIKNHNLPIASVYGEIVEDSVKNKDKRTLLKTTGCKRTGCMFCGFGCHLEKESRFKNMKITHPAQYDYIMRTKEEGGLNYKAVIDWLNKYGGLHIEY